MNRRRAADGEINCTGAEVPRPNKRGGFFFDLISIEVVLTVETAGNGEGKTVEQGCTAMALWHLFANGDVLSLRSSDPAQSGIK